MGSLSAANTKFCLDFFKELSKVKRNENIIFSLLSISAALSTVLLGAGGNTAKEMEKVLHTHEMLSTASPGTKRKKRTAKCEEARGAHSQFQELLSALSKSGATCSLSIADRLFGEGTFQFFQQYLDSTRTFYDAQLEAVDFINAAEESREKMNSWVEKQTGGQVSAQPGSGGSRTLEKTLACSFFCQKNICDESTGFQQLKSAVTYEKLAEWTGMKNVYPQKITLYLPQFRIEESCELIPSSGDEGCLHP